MNMIRRELPRSFVVGHRGCLPLRHSGATRILRTAASVQGSGRSKPVFIPSDRRHHRKLPGNRPHKAGQLPRHRHDGHLRQFIAMGQAPKFSV
jgi:hypothetical protein